jgi:hypothetical protein
MAETPYLVDSNVLHPWGKSHQISLRDRSLSSLN